MHGQVVHPDPYTAAMEVTHDERVDEIIISTFPRERSRWQRKDLAEGSGTTGGYTVAPLYARELLQLAAEESIVRPFANVKTLPAREAFYPMLNQTFTPAGGATSFGGSGSSYTTISVGPCRSSW